MRNSAPWKFPGGTTIGSIIMVKTCPQTGLTDPWGSFGWPGPGVGMSQDQGAAESILAIDCGTTMTRVLLTDRVEGEHRLVARGIAPSTFAPPWSDMTVSVRWALDQLAEVTERRLVDAFSSKVQPLMSCPLRVKNQRQQQQMIISAAS